MLNRRALDVLLPMLYVGAVAIAAVTAGSGTLTFVITVGAVLVGAYFVARRQNL